MVPTQIVAPVSSGKKDSMILYIGICIGLGIWCIYDGYINSSFIARHHNEQGRPDSTLLINRVGGPVLLLAGAGLVGWLYRLKGKAVIATADALIVNQTLQIPYQAIQKIDKTHFQDRGYFLLTYTGPQGTRTIRVDQRDYDNLGPILERLIGAMG